MADARVSLAAAQLNRNENGTLKLIQGLNTTHAKRVDNEEEICKALEATKVANTISPSTVTGLVFPENVEMLGILLPFLSKTNQTYLQVGARIKNCSVHTDSLKQHATQLNFVMCSIFPDFSCNTTELAVDSVVRQYNTTVELLKFINPNLEVQIGETGWPSFGKDESLYNVANMKDYWERMAVWAEQNEVVVYMHEAFDQPWKSDPRRADPNDTTGRFGVWGFFGW